MPKEKIYRAGVIPYYINEGQVKMLFQMPSDPKYGGKSFQIGKGKQEDGESSEETAFREANEELGLFKGNIISIHDLGNFLGRTQIFLAEIKDPDMFGDHDSEIKETKWMTFEEFEKIGRELHIPLVKAAVRWITKENDLE